MKANGTITGQLILGCVLACYLSLFSLSTFAIEGLQVSVPETNAVLSWPSDPSESYIIQYKPSLTSTSNWTTLSDFYPADSSTNITVFVDPNPIDFGSTTNGSSGGGSGDGGMTPPGGGGGSGGSSTVSVPGLGFYRVVRDGAHLYEITNDTVLSGVIRIPVELANGSGAVSTMSLTEDNSPVGDSIQTAPLSSPLALRVDTTRMVNGVHQVSVSARWDDTNGGLWEAVSPPISVTISNEISFENWMPEFGELGDSLLIRATSAHPDTDWYIDVYDSQYSYIGTFGGHTYDGDIQVAWNLIGPSNEPHTNDTFFIFKVSTDYIDPPSPKTYKHLEKWSGHGAWVIVAQHAWDTYHDVDLLYGELGGFIGGALGRMLACFAITTRSK